MSREHLKAATSGNPEDLDKYLERRRIIDEVVVGIIFIGMFATLLATLLVKL